MYIGIIFTLGFLHIYNFNFFLLITQKRFLCVVKEGEGGGDPYTVCCLKGKDYL